MDVPLAIEVYRRLGDIAVVKSLIELEGIEERNLLAGHLVSMLGSEHETAEVLCCLSILATTSFLGIVSQKLKTSLRCPDVGEARPMGKSWRAR